MFLQLADGGQAVHRVSGKTTHALGNDQVYLHAVFDTKKKAVSGSKMSRNGFISRPFTVLPAHLVGM